jgi:hypothetical protein
LRMLGNSRAADRILDRFLTGQRPFNRARQAVSDVESQLRFAAHSSSSSIRYNTRRPNFRKHGPPPTTRSFSRVLGERFRNAAASLLERKGEILSQATSAGA